MTICKNTRPVGLFRQFFLIRTFKPIVIGLLFAALVFATAQAQRRVVAGSDDRTVDAAARAGIVDAVAAALNEVYVFPQKAADMEELIRLKLKEGAYDHVTGLMAFTDLLTKDLRSICRDKHLRVMPAAPIAEEEGQGPSPEEERARRLAEQRYQNFGFYSVERLDGNIGYIDLRMFADASSAGDTAIAALNFLANCDALVFDLRQNGGGSPSMIQLISSYLFDEPQHLNSFYIRKTDETRQFWTQAQVEGPRLTDLPVYVLTSRYTFSAAEEFTYNLKNMERATIVGETTGGGAHPVEFRRFEEYQVEMSLPFGRAINPITETNWEGTGIAPHIQVPADEALDAARLDAMKNLVDKIADGGKRKQLEWAMKTLEAARNPVSLSEAKLKPYVGAFGPRSIRLKGGNLFYKRDDRPEFELVPMGDDLFGLKGLEYFRIQFVRDSAGNVTKLVGLYDNGLTDANERTGG